MLGSVAASEGATESRGQRTRSRAGQLARCAAVLACVAALPAAALAQSGRQLTVANTNRSVSIQRVWTAAAGTNEVWTEATLTRPIAPNGSTLLTFSAGATCFFDVKVQFSDGVTQTFSNVNACHSDRVIAE